jgi:hypothetical protein
VNTLSENLFNSVYRVGGAIEVYPKDTPNVQTLSTTSQTVFLQMFVSPKTMTVGTASAYIVTAGVGTTLFRLGLYTWSDATGTATLVARTANDTTMAGTSSVLQSRAFDTTGGFPSTYTLTAGSVYALGVLWVGTTTAPIVYRKVITSLGNITTKTAVTKASQSDLSTVGTWTDSTNLCYGRFS